MKRSLRTLILLLSVIFVGGLVAIDTTSALEFQTDPSGGASNNPVTLKFRFGETLTITTGGTITITGLVPGASDISASNYVVTVNTNNATGYTLSATVGCETGTSCYDSKNLSDGTNNFTMLSSTGTLTAGTWGVSLDSNATKASNFQTLAKWDDVSPTTINQTTDATGTAATGYQGTNNTTVRIGAYAASTQATGTYTNVINFIAVTNMSTADSIYMQDQTASSMAQLLPYEGYTTVLTDRRDGQKYSIAKINGAYWMTRNLAIGCNGTGSTYGDTITNVALDSTNSNVTNTSSSPWNTPTLSLDKTDETTGCTTSDTSGCNSYTDARMKCSSTYGAWYNYAAATAGTIATDSTMDEDIYNICPKGWTLPNYDTNSPAGSINSVTSFLDAFSPVTGGFYGGGAIYYPTNGYWWSTTAYNGANRRYLYYVGSSLGTSIYIRRNGLYVRCIKV